MRRTSWHRTMTTTHGGAGERMTPPHGGGDLWCPTPGDLHVDGCGDCARGPRLPADPAQEPGVPIANRWIGISQMTQYAVYMATMITVATLASCVRPSATRKRIGCAPLLVEATPRDEPVNDVLSVLPNADIRVATWHANRSQSVLAFSLAYHPERASAALDTGDTRPYMVTVLRSGSELSSWWAHGREPFMVSGGLILRIQYSQTGLAEDRDWEEGPLVIAHSAATGCELWRLTLPAPSLSPPVYRSLGVFLFEWVAIPDSRLVAVRSGPVVRHAWIIDPQAGLILKGPTLALSAK